MNPAEKYAKKLADTLKRERLDRNLSHDQLAKMSGLTRPAISHIESGKRNPSMQNVYKLITSMGMTMEDFIQKVERP